MFWTIRKLRKQQEKTEHQLNYVQSQLRETQDYTRDLENRLKDLKKDLEDCKDAVQEKDNELESLRRLSNARLSAMTGAKRYLDSFFKQEEERKDNFIKGH